MAETRHQAVLSIHKGSFLGIISSASFSKRNDGRRGNVSSNVSAALIRPASASGILAQKLGSFRRLRGVAKMQRCVPLLLGSGMVPGKIQRRTEADMGGGVTRVQRN